MLLHLALRAFAGDVAAELVPAEAEYRIGEPLWMDLVVRNDGPDTVDGAFAPRFLEAGVIVEAIGPDGRRALDPYHMRIQPFSFGMDEAPVAPGTERRVRFDLAEYAWLDAPGTWTVRLFHPLGGTRDAGADDPRWTHAQLLLVVPTADEARAIVEALPRTREGQLHPRSTEPEVRWSSLGHARYVPILEPLAAASLPTERGVTGNGVSWSGSSRVDERALRGLAACPCREATAALLRLYDGFTDPELRRWVTDELLWRLPDPYDDGTSSFPARVRARAFTPLAWDDALERGVLARARAAVASSDPRAVEWGAKVVQAAGAAADGPALVEALARVRADDRAVQAVMAALRKFPAPIEGADDATRLLLELEGWSRGKQVPPPPGWSDVVLRGIRSGDSRAITYALARCPPDPDPVLAAAILSQMDAPDPRVRGAARDCMASHPVPAYAGPVLAAFDVSDDDLVGGSLMGAAMAMAPRDVVLELLIAKLGAPGSDQARMMILSGSLSGWREGEEGLVSADEVPRLRAAWTSFVAEHRATLAAGGTVRIDEADPALLPRSFVFVLPSGEKWPPSAR